MGLAAESPGWARREALRRQPEHPRHVMYQSWEQLLFLHWCVEAAPLQALLPPGLTVDTYEGAAYVGIIPFFMNWIRPRFLPPLPWLSFFLETNVRTYVYDAAGNAGVWFFSLDCNQPLAVWLARAFFHLPYRHARMKAGILGQAVDYQTRRWGAAEGSRFVYEPDGPPSYARPESLEYFLVERYLLFAARNGRLATGRVYHTPYPLQPVRLNVWDDRLLAPAGIPAVARPPDHALMSTGVDVRVYPLVAVAGSGPMVAD